MIDKEIINIVWFKRDLRLHDHGAIAEALKGNRRVLFIYVFEQILIEDPHYSERHWNFIKQSITHLNTELEPYNSKILTVQSDIISIFNLIQSNTFIVHKCL